MSRWVRLTAVVFPHVAVGSLLLSAPHAAHACAVCFGGQDSADTRMAFILTTVLMTFLPLLMIGVVVWWLRRRFRQLELEQARAATMDRAWPARGGESGDRASEIAPALDPTVARSRAWSQR